MGAATHGGREGRGGSAGARTALIALALANARFWPTVAPAVRGELRRWRQPAGEIPDDALRTLALEKLAGESFNAEVAATLATLAPWPRRATAVRAIVALELLFDYLDGRTELPAADPIADSEALFRPFIEAVTAPGSGGQQSGEREPGDAGADRGYLSALSESVRDGMFALPAARTVAGVARAGAERCAQAQTRLHAAPALGEEQLRRWAAEQGSGSGLAWREYAAGCASSVLSLHALIAAAADPNTSEQDAQRTDAAYLAMGAVITILDSVVDHAEDSAHGRAGFIGRYEPGELPARMRELTREALARCREAPHGAHHAMTLAGVVAYYTSHPGAGDQGAREIVTIVRAQLAPTIWPALAVMGGWRAAKRARAAAVARAGFAGAAHRRRKDPRAGLE